MRSQTRLPEEVEILIWPFSLREKRAVIVKTSLKRRFAQGGQSSLTGKGLACLTNLHSPPHFRQYAVSRHALDTYL